MASWMHAGALALGVLAIAGTARADAGVRADDDSGDDVPSCVDYHGEAVYVGYGYNHIVHVENGCEQLAVCQVWTDVNPDKQTVEVPAGEEKEVVTYRGSPAREFEAHARCHLEDA